MPIARKFLGWDQPPLPACVRFLSERYRHADRLDLSGVVVVVPGSRAGRRLLELLVDAAEAPPDADRPSLVFVPPKIITVGALPELLYVPKRPFADRLTQRLAWSAALQSLDPDRLVTVVANPPGSSATERWLELAELFQRQHRELAADDLDFGDVAERGSQVDGFGETARWQILSEVQQAYLNILDGLALWDRQTARRFAIRHEECRTDLDIVLAGTVDMNHTMRRMLDKVADRVTALIFAPQELADRFDEHGALVPDLWQEARLDVRTEQVRVVDRPADQARAVTEVMAGLSGRYRADEIIVGLGDESLVPQVERQLTARGVTPRWVIGPTLADSAPFRLLEAMAMYLEGLGDGNDDRRGPRFDDFAALVRHPDVERWLAEQLGGEPESRLSLSKLDGYRTEHLQPRLDEWLGRQHEWTDIRSAAQAVDRLLQPLLVEPQPVGRWASPILNVLQNVFQNVIVDRDVLVDQASMAECSTIRDVLAEIGSVPESIAPVVTAAEAVRLALQALRDETVRSPVVAEAVELLGWLELPLDDAPALIVTGVNEGRVPESVNSDLFLPNRLRRALGVMDNARRYARDAYALSVLLHSREHLTLVVGRRDADGNPLRPSRLLFATDEDQIPQRVLDFYEGSQPDDSEPVAMPQAGGDQRTEFVIPRPLPPFEPMDKIRVTAFRTYLACPYRFYLRHVLNLEPLHDEATEMNPLRFGSLLHAVLDEFGRSEVRQSVDAGEIREFLGRTLDECVLRAFGRQRRAAVNVQVHQLRTRLDAFADWQAGWATEGWRIEFTEVPQSAAGREPAATATPLDEPVRLTVDDQSVVLSGRIDRIDRNRHTGQWAVLDYKSGDSDKTPDQIHRKRDEWVDLQLPLYRHLARPLGVEGSIRLGYVVLPKDVGKTGVRLAEWTDGQLVEADDVARDVVRRVLNHEFWPPAEDPDLAFNEFEAICQDSVFARVLESEPAVAGFPPCDKATRKQGTLF